ncbi:uncharacterized protein EAE97_012026 [Botrytis byssoidea]|uniref:Uncharacterized protein n=1 Tax=Botrytis byssoidea TaxID=139641 RepID=A0A9P5HTG4_9HELO|nr:uncharacterized protein EAE97_012026 [Botrytis byssoidea]KAF7917498.1 hypothetical protein EAE97_012026 [Botrytis byssoidea]
MLEWSEVATWKTNRPCGFMSRTVLDYESDTAVISGPLGFPAAIFCMTDGRFPPLYDRQQGLVQGQNQNANPTSDFDCQILANENLRGSSSIAVC